MLGLLAGRIAVDPVISQRRRFGHECEEIGYIAYLAAFRRVCIKRVILRAACDADG